MKNEVKVRGKAESSREVGVSRECVMRQGMKVVRGSINGVRDEWRE